MIIFLLQIFLHAQDFKDNPNESFLLLFCIFHVLFIRASGPSIDIHSIYILFTNTTVDVVWHELEI